MAFVTKHLNKFFKAFLSTPSYRNVVHILVYIIRSQMGNRPTDNTRHYSRPRESTGRQGVP